MKKKATLLIQHLETIYTMIPPHFTCVHHGFIAFHHEQILCVEEGEGWEYVDKDTRIIEGCNHIAVPGFIDVSMQISSFTTLASTVVKMRELGEIRMKNGTLIGNLNRILTSLEKKACSYLQAPYEFDYVSTSFHTSYPVVYPLAMNARKSYKRFCISSNTTNAIDCLDQLLCAKVYYQATGIDPIHILSACTIYPARMLQLQNVGTLAKNKKGNVLIMEGKSFKDVLNKFHGNHTLQVIKEGTRILPNIII